MQCQAAADIELTSVDIETCQLHAAPSRVDCGQRTAKSAAYIEHALPVAKVRKLEDDVAQSRLRCFEFRCRAECLVRGCLLPVTKMDVTAGSSGLEAVYQQIEIGWDAHASAPAVDAIAGLALGHEAAGGPAHRFAHDRRDAMEIVTGIDHDHVAWLQPKRHPLDRGEIGLGRAAIV